MIQFYFRDDTEVLRRVEGWSFLYDNELILYAYALFLFASIFWSGEHYHAGDFEGRTHSLQALGDANWQCSRLHLEKVVCQGLTIIDGAFDESGTKDGTDQWLAGLLSVSMINLFKLYICNGLVSHL